MTFLGEGEWGPCQTMVATVVSNSEKTRKALVECDGGIRVCAYIGWRGSAVVCSVISQFLRGVLLMYCVVGRKHLVLRVLMYFTFMLRG